jgi:hypothetical protein
MDCADPVWYPADFDKVLYFSRAAIYNWSQK